MVTVTVSEDNSAVYFEPCIPSDDLGSKLVDDGLFVADAARSISGIALSTTTARLLRQALRGVDITLRPEHAKTLAHYADRKEVSAHSVLPALAEGHVIINEPALPQKAFSSWQSIKNRSSVQSLAYGVYQVKAQCVEGLLPTLPRGSVAPSVASRYVVVPESATPQKTPQNRTQPQPRTEIPALSPFTKYDGSLASLSLVGLNEYTYIQEDASRRGKNGKNVLVKGLQKMGIHNAFDVLHYYPYRYIDRSTPELVSRLQEGQKNSTIVGTVSSVTPTYKQPRSGTSYVDIGVKDVMGDVINARFFRQMYLSKTIRPNDQVILQGTPKRFGRTMSMNTASIEKINADGVTLQIVPVYKQSDINKVKSAHILNLVQETIGRMKSNPLREFIPQELITRYQIPSRMEAYQDIHIASSSQATHDARRRLEYEELLRLQLFIQNRKKDYESNPGTQFEGDYPMTQEYVTSLPYSLTNAQDKALREIFKKFTLDSPMNCLLQGDVGSGKSVVANAASLRATEAGFQVALMAPTEILAEQLYEGMVASMSTLISPRSGTLMNIRFMGGKVTAKNKRIIEDELASGSVDIIVGTSSLLFDKTFKNLGLVVIDEQHRFGVEQRDALLRVRDDGKVPHLLSMSATPIPRSSAMVVYGDMDILVLDELPPGRIPISTEWVEEEATATVVDPDAEHWHTVREQVSQGHQAYVVASLVEDNEELAAQSVKDAYEMLSSVIFPSLRVAMVHGKQNSKERAAIMEQFSNGDVDVLVATTVIEVGVNVPNATVMVILDPGRFGIAQLHQIRGRVGRSTYPSTCYLVGSANTDIGVARLMALTESTDGFYLAEKDLELRGEGTLFGKVQSGDTDLRLASLQHSLPTLMVAKGDAQDILGGNSLGFDADMAMHEVDAFMVEKEIKS